MKISGEAEYLRDVPAAVDPTLQIPSEFEEAIVKKLKGKNELWYFHSRERIAINFIISDCFGSYCDHFRFH